MVVSLPRLPSQSDLKKSFDYDPSSLTTEKADFFWTNYMDLVPIYRKNGKRIEGWWTFVELDRLDIVEDFDIVDGIAMDAMHLMHLGITKKLWKLLGSPANVFPRQKKRQISLQWHQLFINRKVTLEMGHKTSDLPVTNTFKASDWQLLITLAFDDIAINFNGLWS